ncbi:OsmC family protein [Streptomyces sp. NBC_01619]|uniref:OsmC family protein n=1 Tax=Streptomyces sp. NBC_01619 TaxID=2975901 RepID=UPI0022514F25|nr:OsmC family protein [Streptomyces sp. NBC_01619]MCX4513880.1 OsmC family protein [Streptomyces sp. NBC_01619]
MSARTVSVREGQHLVRTIEVGPHRLTADASEPFGTDAAPTPTELVLAALGSCTSMAVRGYANRHGFQLQSVDVDVRVDPPNGPRQQIVRSIRLVGDLEEEQTEKLLAAAGRCPVHRLLTESVTVATQPTILAASHRSADPELSA